MLLRRSLPSLAFTAALSAALVGHAVTGGAQQPGADRSRYQPGIDVVDYDVRLALPDTGAFIAGDVTVTARRDATVGTLRLDLVGTLTVRQVTVDGRDVAPVRDGATIRIPLDGAAGDTVRVRVRYDGVVTDGLIVQRDQRGRWTWFGDNWPDRARQWLPTVDHPSDKATVSFTVRAPASRTVVANGTLLGVERLTGDEAGRSETRWRESRPIATYLMVIGAGPLARTELSASGCVTSAVHRCVPQMIYAMPESGGFLPGPFAAAPAIVSYFEELVGPFPYEKLAHLQSATRFGGMENASAIFYADQLFVGRTLSDGLIAHETAHQWFGDAVTEREWGHLWLSEGFATYFAALWTRKAHGEAAFAREMATIRRQILDDSVVATRPVIDTLQRDYLRLLNANSYQKGGYVLYMLNQRLGDSAFHSGLRSYYQKYRDGNASSDDLRRELESASGDTLVGFFDQWLRRPGVALPSVGWAYDAARQSVSVFVAQEGGAPPYALSLPVVVTSRDGSVDRGWISVPAQPRATVVLPARFTGRPQSVAIDPEALALARLTRL
jgi:aminopeptidase N